MTDRRRCCTILGYYILLWGFGISVVAIMFLVAKDRVGIPLLSWRYWIICACISGCFVVIHITLCAVDRVRQFAPWLFFGDNIDFPSDLLTPGLVLRASVANATMGAVVIPIATFAAIASARVELAGPEIAVVCATACLAMALHCLTSIREVRFMPSEIMMITLLRFRVTIPREDSTRIDVFTTAGRPYYTIVVIRNPTYRFRFWFLIVNPLTIMTEGGHRQFVTHFS